LIIFFSWDISIKGIEAGIFRADTLMKKIMGITRYLDLYDFAPVGYIIVSEQGLILEANLTVATLLGKPRSALVKQPIDRFIHKEDQDVYYLHRKRLLATDGPQVCEIRMVKSDNSIFWSYLTATLSHDDDGVSICRIVLSNITERKKVENELE
jgi:PAS domain S-box-containing protein